MHVFRIAKALQNLRAGADLVRTEMSKRQIGQVVPHCAVFEDVHSVLGPQDAFLQRLWGLIPGGEAQDTLQCLRLALSQMLQSLVIELLYVDLHLGDGSRLFSRIWGISPRPGCCIWGRLSFFLCSRRTRNERQSPLFCSLCRRAAQSPH